MYHETFRITADGEETVSHNLRDISQDELDAIIFGLHTYASRRNLDLYRLADALTTEQEENLRSNVATITGILNCLR